MKNTDYLQPGCKPDEIDELSKPNPTEISIVFSLSQLTELKMILNETRLIQHSLIDKVEQAFKKLWNRLDKAPVS